MRYTPASINKLPPLPGIYIFKNREEDILYVGKGKDLKKRISSYFRTRVRDVKTSSLVRQIAVIEIILAGSEFEALLLEAKLIKKYQPKYNIIWKDDKHYIYIKISHETFPRILLSRKDEEKNATYFGPFPSSKTTRRLLSVLRTIFPYCAQNRQIKRPCFYTHIALCHPCPGEIMKLTGNEFNTGRKIYRKNIQQIKFLLGGKITTVKNYLTKKMKFYAADENYEQAAKYRNKITDLEYLIRHYQPPETYVDNPNFFQQRSKLETIQLTNILNKYFKITSVIKKIECYDISNISGKFATGSLVCFIDGLPAKDYYRRFRIKTVGKADDFAMLTEVMQRRLLHKEWGLPDLLIIDGGKPQLLAMKKVLSHLGVNLPMIGLAKQQEELVIPVKNQFPKLKLPRNSAALQLVQRIRDEAHRFAHKYHTLLRLKHLLAV